MLDEQKPTETAPEKPPSLPFTILPFEILAQRDLTPMAKNCIAGMFYFLLRKGDIKGSLESYISLAVGVNHKRAADAILECKRKGFTLKALRDRYAIILGQPAEEKESA